MVVQVVHFASFVASVVVEGAMEIRRFDEDSFVVEVGHNCVVVVVTVVVVAVVEVAFVVVENWAMDSDTLVAVVEAQSV